MGLCARRGYRMGGAEMSRLRHTGRFVAGQTIRGYDCVGRTDCYLQGVVRDANYTRPHDGVLCYEIDVTVEMFGGEDITTPNDIGWIPHEVSLFEYDGRILEVSPNP